MDNEHPQIAWKLPKFTPRRLIAVLFAIQIAMVLLIWFGDFGDLKFAGEYGFDLRHLVLFSAIYLLAFASGVIYAIVKRHFGLAILQVAILLAAFMWFYRPAPHYRASELQHLVGADKATVDAELGWRGRVSSLSTRGDVSFWTWTYDGVAIVFSPDERVVEVVPYDRSKGWYSLESGSGLSPNLDEWSDGAAPEIE